MPLITCEMRWLLEGALPAEVERWFHRGSQPGAPAWRQDRYLILPGVADLGIKQRAGKLEIKGCLAALGVHAIASEVEGAAERWCKWSYDAVVAERFRGPAEIVLGKARVQKHFLLEPGGRTRETAQRDPGRRGFSLELTQIRHPEAGDHWSLGIEAAPDDANLLADLLRALRDALRSLPVPLPRARSQSYPAWLLAMADTARRMDGQLPGI
jgi:hypothetical protein